MGLIQNRLGTLTLALCSFFAILTLVTFAANIRAINLLDHAFWARTDWYKDFDSITQLMIARAIWHGWKSTELTDSDFYKLTGLYCFANNGICILNSPRRTCFILDWLQQTKQTISLNLIKSCLLFFIKERFICCVCEVHSLYLAHSKAKVKLDLYRQ